MVLVFILCGIVTIVALFTCILILSTLKIELSHFLFSNIEDIKKEYQFKISLCLFGKLKWFGIKVSNKQMPKILYKINWQKIDFKKMEKDFSFEDFRQVKKLQPTLSYFHLETKIGVEDAISTSFLVGGISIIISLLLPHFVQKYEEDKYQYKIVPLYVNQNVYEIKFDGIIEIRMVHIINILYYFLKKRREKKYEQRTSDRRAYGYSYE